MRIGERERRVYVCVCVCVCVCVYCMLCIAFETAARGLGYLPCSLSFFLSFFRSFFRLGPRSGCYAPSSNVGLAAAVCLISRSMSGERLRECERLCVCVCVYICRDGVGLDSAGFGF